MKRLILTIALAAVAVSGCAHLNPNPSASGGASAVEENPNPGASRGASAVEEQSPYPKTFPNDHYHAL
jgi:hypothetical protein